MRIPRHLAQKIGNKQTTHLSRNHINQNVQQAGTQRNLCSLHTALHRLPRTIEVFCLKLNDSCNFPKPGNLFQYSCSKKVVVASHGGSFYSTESLHFDAHLNRSRQQRNAEMKQLKRTFDLPPFVLRNLVRQVEESVAECLDAIAKRRNRRGDVAHDVAENADRLRNSAVKKFCQFAILLVER